MNIKIIILPLLFTLLLLSSCQTRKSEVITYRDKNYSVPEDEIWNLTWSSPYKSGDIHPAYDVRVFGALYGEDNIGQVEKALYNGKPFVLNVFAENVPASIWLGPNTEFSIANEFVKVNILKYKK